MRLRKQLLIVSLVSLALPWAGIQYMREMESTLRQGEVQVLRATSKAIASVLMANQGQLQAVKSTVDYLREPDDTKKTAPRMVAHPLVAPIILDGYKDDWLQYSWRAQPLVSSKESLGFNGNFVVGEKGATVSFFIQVTDTHREYFNPSSTLQKSDYIQLYLPAEDALFDVFTSAPGEVRVVKTHVSGKTLSEHEIKGVWQESTRGYQVEMNVPWRYLSKGAQLQVHDGSSEQFVLNNSSAPVAVVSQNSSLQNTLKHFGAQGMRLYVFDAQGYVLADVGSLQSGQVTQLYQSAAYRLVRRILGYGQLEQNEALQWVDVQNTGFTELSESFLEADVFWAGNKKRISRALVPITDAQSDAEVVLGYVLAEKNTNAANVLITGAAGRLLFYTIACSVFAGLFCVAYASWLSFRIRRLSRFVDDALDAQGRINAQLPNTKSADEIGDLSRSYAVLLSRLHEYTEYLQNLSSKLSHELRTPLAVIKSSLDNLLQLPTSEDAKQYAVRALSGADRLSGILTAMSAANRIEQSLQSSDKERMNCNALLVEVSQAYSDIYATKNIAYRVEGEGPWWVSISPDLFVQMLDKLIENAADFTADGEVIDIHLARSKNGIIVRVVNPGPLLPEAMQNQIFDSLVSLRDANSSSHHFGLGLYIVRMIARFHGGTVLAYNQPNNQSNKQAHEQDESLHSKVITGHGGKQKEGHVVFEVTLPAAE